MALEGVTSRVSSTVSSVSSTIGMDSRNAEKYASSNLGKMNGTTQSSNNKPVNDEGKVFPSINNDEEGKNMPGEKTIKQVVSDINRKLNNNTLAEFGYHEETNRVTIKIVDKDTKEVVKEIPPEKTLDLIAKAWELAGILVDEKK